MSVQSPISFKFWTNFVVGYCGNTIDSTSTNATTQADCSFSCPGNQYEYCGAGNRLQMYKLSPVSSSVSSSSSLSTVNAVAASTSSSSTPAQSPMQTISTSASAPATTSTSTSQSSTLQSATSTSSLSSSISSSSSSFPSSSSTSSSTTTSKIATYTGPPVTSQGNVNFTYYSCLSEPSSGRALQKQVENNGTYMTIEKCLSNCWMYQYAGVEYGREVSNPGLTSYITFPMANFCLVLVRQYPQHRERQLECI
jgi:hypothetical protein